MYNLSSCPYCFVNSRSVRLIVSHIKPISFIFFIFNVKKKCCIISFIDCWIFRSYPQFIQCKDCLDRIVDFLFSLKLNCYRNTIFFYYYSPPSGVARSVENPEGKSSALSWPGTNYIKPYTGAHNVRLDILHCCDTSDIGCRILTNFFLFLFFHQRWVPSSPSKILKGPRPLPLKGQ